MQKTLDLLVQKSQISLNQNSRSARVKVNLKQEIRKHLTLQSYFFRIIQTDNQELIYNTDTIKSSEAITPAIFIDTNHKRESFSLIDHDSNKIDSTHSLDLNNRASHNGFLIYNANQMLTNSSHNDYSKDISFNNHLKFTEEQDLSSIDNSYIYKTGQEGSYFNIFDNSRLNAANLGNVHFDHSQPTFDSNQSIENIRNTNNSAFVNIAGSAGLPKLNNTGKFNFSGPKM